MFTSLRFIKFLAALGISIIIGVIISTYMERDTKETKLIQKLQQIKKDKSNL